MRQRLILASGSPRRRELLARMGVAFEVCAADVDESVTGAPEAVVRALALRKARAVAEAHPGRTILAADTIVYCDGQILGKPRDADDALRMLLLLSGREHQVYTGVCLINGATGAQDTRCDCTQVRFSALGEKEALGYIRSGECMDKAGAYAVQGMGGMFVTGIAGSPSNVIGLPMHVVRDMLLAIGWEMEA